MHLIRPQNLKHCGVTRVKCTLCLLLFSNSLTLVPVITLLADNMDIKKEMYGTEESTKKRM